MRLMAPDKAASGADTGSKPYGQEKWQTHYGSLPKPKSN